MSDVYTILIPKVAAAGFSVNPVGMNTATVLSVTVVEETVELEPSFWYSNEIYSGEV